jgi:hypothetical protein
MFENPNSPETINLPEIDANKLTSVKKVIEFLDKHLPSFPIVFKKRTSSKTIEGEDLISQELCDYLQFLTYKDGIFMFQFQRRSFESSHSSDFAVIAVENYNLYQLSHAFFVIEAKRLPTPGKDKKNISREKEYVQGNSGGIQRYKKGNHGTGLLESAMIGYIQDDHNCLHWQQEINKWINDLISNNTDVEICWDSSDLLNEVSNFGKIRKYDSQNTRLINSKKDSIKLHHYLMELA